MGAEALRWLRSSGLALTVAAGAVAAGIGIAPRGAHAAVYAVTDRGVAFESVDDGVTWAAKGSISESGIESLSPGLTAGHLYALGVSGTLYRSTDAAASWDAVGNAGASDCVSLAVGRGGDLIVLTRSGDVAASSDGGTTWTSASSVGASDCVALTIGGDGGAVDTLFAVTSSGDVAISPTGAVWTNVGATGYTPIVDILWVAGRLHALTDAGEIVESSDNGAAWTAIATLSQVGMRDLAHAGGKFKAISKEGEVYESASGASWSPSWIGTTNQVFTVAFAAGVPEFQTGVGYPAPPTVLSIDAWPNPFTSEARLALSIRGTDAEPSASTEIAVYDAAGRMVATLFSGTRAAVPNDLAWRGDGASPGIYFLRVRSGNFTDTERLVFLR